MVGDMGDKKVRGIWVVLAGEIRAAIFLEQNLDSRVRGNDITIFAAASVARAPPCGDKRRSRNPGISNPRITPLRD